jgi:thioesterase domain-containing protein
VEENFFDVGGNSILLIRVLAQLESQIGTGISVAEFFQNATIAQLTERVFTRRAEQTETSVVQLCFGKGTPIFCVHPGGGYVHHYAKLAEYLAAGHSVYGLQASAHRAPLRSIPEIAAKYVADIRRTQSKGPYRLIGWSLGGLIAFEMARHLNAINETVSFLGLLDTRGIGTADEPDYEHGIVARLNNYLPPTFSLIHLRTLDPPEQLAYVLTELASVQSQPLAVLEAMHMYEALEAARRNYVPEVYDGMVTFIAPAEEYPNTIRAADYWSELTNKQLCLLTVAGDHQTILEEPHVHELAMRLLDNVKNGRA